MRYIIFFLTTSLFLMSCNEDAYLRLPVVEMSSVEVTGTDIILSGKVIDDGNSGIYTLGFCYAQNQSPQSINQNQTLVDWIYEDGTFGTVIQGLKQDSTYYFKSFIITTTGSAISEAVSYTVPRFTAPEAPCENNLTTNRVTDDGRNYSVTAYVRQSVFSETYDILVNCGSWNPDITISFREKPITGIYKTVDRIERYGATNDVAIKISKTIGYGTPTMPISSGQSVYLNCIDENKIIISFCDLAYIMQVNNTNHNVVLSGKIELGI